MVIQHRGVKTKLFFGGISIQFAAYGFEAVQNMERLALTGAFKGHMFPEMRNTQLFRFFVAAANIQHKTAVGNFGMRNLLVYNANAVRQGMQVIIRHEIKSWPAKLRKITRISGLYVLVGGQFLVKLPDLGNRALGPEAQSLLIAVLYQPGA